MSISRTTLEKMWQSAIKEKNGDLAISFYSPRGCLMWLDKDTLHAQMLEWRKLAKGKSDKGADTRVAICDYNNNEYTDPQGKVWHTLIVQPYHSSLIAGKDYGEMRECQFDPVALLLFGTMVSGYMYAFKSKANRDSIAEYVMKGLTQPPAEGNLF